MQFLDLPVEVIHRILSLLPPTQVATCQLVNNQLDAIISESLVLQYTIALALAMADDDPCSVVSLPQKLENIRSSEAAWASLQPKFIASVPVPQRTSGIYDLSAGTYLLGNVDRMTLQYLRLPARVYDPLDWRRITVDKVIIDMGFCVFEHDLIAVITSTQSTAQIGLCNVEMTLLEYSTGKPHPRAKNSTILVTSYITGPSILPSLMCEIVGENLVLILNFMHDMHHEDRIFIWNWCSNVLKTSFFVPYRTYSGILFVEEDLIILPNSKSAAFDFFRIPTKPTANTLKPIFSLQLPALADGLEIDTITCRAEPNPIPDVSWLYKRQRAQCVDVGLDEMDPFASKRGFLASGEDAICLFHMSFREEIPGGVNINFDPTSSYTLFVHRSSFLKTVRQYEKACNSPRQDGQADPGIALDSRRIPWVDWGPPVSRWFNANFTRNRWITTSAGQRCVMIYNRVGEYGSPMTILDFNPFSIRKVKAKTKRENEVAMAMTDSAGEEEPVSPSPSAHSRTRTETVISQDMDAEDGSDPVDMSLFSGIIGEMDIGEDQSTTDDSESDIFILEDADSDSIPDLESVVNSDDECNTPSTRYTTNSQDHRRPGLSFCRVFESPSKELPGTFAEEVEGRLPYIKYVSEREYDYKGVLLDEERIIGLMTNGVFRLSAIDIFYFG